ncbi:MAG TPA: hypothetical protein DDY86_00210 [Syntrophaceae bacterium]|nr:hypothetical protein [Syntrophaceae bacterium]
MWTWILNIKNLALVILAVCVLLLGTLYIWQRNSVVSLTAKVDALTVENNQQQGTITEMKDNLEAMKRSQVNMQKIAKATATIQESINRLQVKELTDEEKRVASDITRFFNDRMLPVSLQTGNNAPGGEVLSGAGKTDPFKPGDHNPVGR